MKKIIILIVIVAAAYGGITLFKIKDKEAFTNASRERVEKMLAGIQSKQSALENDAIGYWYDGNPDTSFDEAIVNGFDAFKTKKGIYAVRNYEVLSATLVNGDDQVGRWVEVRFKANGKSLGVIVRHKSTMEWMN